MGHTKKFGKENNTVKIMITKSLIFRKKISWKQFFSGGKTDQ